jgi:hypothetical protein
MYPMHIFGGPPATKHSGTTYYTVTALSDSHTGRHRFPDSQAGLVAQPDLICRSAELPDERVIRKRIRLLLPGLVLNTRVP